MSKKQTVSYTVDRDVLDGFEEKTDSLKLKRSRIVQQLIKQWLNEN